MADTPLVLFALNASREFGVRVAQGLGVALAAHEEREFADGEHKARPLVNVRGRDVFVVQSLYSDAAQSVNDKLCRLLFFLGALGDAAAARVTAVIPYLAYARKDRKTQPRDPVTTRYVAALLEAVGVERVVTLDVHNPAAYQNAFRCRSELLEAHGLFADHLAPVLRDEKRVVVLSPDIGGVKRAERLRALLERRLGRELGTAFFAKARAKGEVSFGRLCGEVGGAAVVIVDDLIGTGATLLNAARQCRTAGSHAVYAVASHGLFVGAANDALADPALAQVIVTDTIPPFRLHPALREAKVAVLGAAPLFAAALRRLHEGGSLLDLLAQ